MCYSPWEKTPNTCHWGKILCSLFPEIMKGIFKTKTNYYKTFNALLFSKRNVKIVRYGLQTMSYIGSKIWDLVPKEIKQVTTLKNSRPKSKFGS